MQAAVVHMRCTLQRATTLELRNVCWAVDVVRCVSPQDLLDDMSGIVSAVVNPIVAIAKAVSPQMRGQVEQVRAKYSTITSITCSVSTCAAAVLPSLSSALHV